jgi:N-acetylmuramic acid 6-phosphate etherase
VSRPDHPPDGGRPRELLTERHRPELTDLDLATTGELVALMVAEDRLVPAAVEQAADAIVPAIEAVTERLRAGGRLIYVGAGTAGRLGIMDAAECGPTFSMPAGRVVGVLAGGEDAFDAAVEDAEDQVEAGAAALDALEVGRDDAVVGITASGRTPFVLGAIERARGLGAATVGISCNPGAALSARVDHPVEVVVGPELIAGSTRLKAGTAQKLLLNMISTIAMIRLGKTYGNLMVDVRATNEKLRHRARRIVQEATGADEGTARRALAAADDEIRTAIVIVARGISAEEARRRLAHAPSLRAALEGDGCG